MSNYKDFLIGAGGGAYIAPYDQTWSLVDAADGYIYSSSYNRQSSTTYQSFHRLAVDGLYGGIFDPYNSSNSAQVIARSFSVNQSTGAIAVNAATSIWSHSYGDTFSTGHHGAIASTAMYVGHAKNPSYGSTNKGYMFAAEFNNAGAVEQHGYAAAPIEAWPHSNGDLVMCATAVKDGTVYGRRSTYNQGNSRYYYSQNYFQNGSASYDEWTDANSNTSTNYANPAAGQTKAQLDRGGIISYSNSSGVGKFRIIYGNNGYRGTEYDTNTIWGGGPTSNVFGFNLSSGETLWCSESGKAFKSDNSNGNVTALTGSNYPNGTTLLKGIYAGGAYQNSQCIPLGNDTWVFPINNVGWIRMSIDVNNGYAVSADYLWSGLLSPAGFSPSHSGWTYDITGTNNEYFVMAKVEAGAYQIQVLDNPFYGV